MKRLLWALLLTVLLAPVALAQNFPTRPIRIIIPYPPGGLTDVMARLLQEPLRAALGQPVVVENRGGAAGAIAMREVAHSPPDGYVMVLTNNGPTSIIPALRSDAGYTAERSFAPVALVATQPLVVLSSSELPVQDLAGLIRYAKERPDQLNFASGGIGSLGHLAGVLLNDRAGIRAVHVPYPGAAPTLTAVLGHQVQWAVTSYNSAVGEHAAAGRLRVLAVTSPEPWPTIPNVPLAAAAVPGFQAEAWFGLLGPAGIPPAILARLNREVDAALALPAVRQQFLASGLKVQGGGPERLRERIAAEVPLWTRLIRENGIRPE